MLFLEGTRVTDTGLKELAKLKNLRTLRLRGNKLTEAGMMELAKLTQLSTLDLDAAITTVAGLMQLANVKNLSTLQLFGTFLTRRKFKDHADFERLLVGDILDTEEKNVFVCELQKALPNCEIRDGSLLPCLKINE